MAKLSDYEKERIKRSGTYKEQVALLKAKKAKEAKKKKKKSKK